MTNYCMQFLMKNEIQHQNNKNKKQSNLEIKMWKAKKIFILNVKKQ